jgi:hypothetical protein
MTTERCFDCRFFRNFSECHRHAPFTNTGFDTRLVPRANWPNVHGDDWCGDFQSSYAPVSASLVNSDATTTSVRSPEVEEAGEAE